MVGVGAIARLRTSQECRYSGLKRNANKTVTLTIVFTRCVVYVRRWLANVQRCGMRTKDDSKVAG